MNSFPFSAILSLKRISSAFSRIPNAGLPLNRGKSAAVRPAGHNDAQRSWRGNAVAASVLLLFALCGGAARAQDSFQFTGLTPVGVASAQQTVTVTAAKAGIVKTVQVLTLGAPNLDFVNAGGGSCAATNSYTKGATCTVFVTFTPQSPGTRLGAIILTDATGTVMATEYLSGTGEGALGIMVPGTIATIAGDGKFVSLKDGGPATAADLDLPSSMTVDGAGNLYIADSVHNRIRKVDGTGTITTIAGDGSASYTGDGGQAFNSTLSTPRSVALDGAGNLYIADSGNNAIREIEAATGIITTVAGGVGQGFGGDGGQAIAAQLDSPYGVSLDTAGNLYIADTLNQRVRKVVFATGVISTVAGNGYKDANGNGGYSGDGGAATAAELYFPYAVAFDASGNMYIPDSGNNRIREVDTAGTIATFAGNGTQGFSGDGGPAASAELYSPYSVTFDPAGNVYIADTQNYRVRKINEPAGTITTIAGSGIGVYGGDGASATAAGLYAPYSIFLDGQGSLYIADYYDHRIRKVSSNQATLTFTPAIRVGQVTAPQDQSIENDGNAPLTFAAITPDSNAAVDATSTTCSTSGTLVQDELCIVGAEFAPNTVGNPINGNIQLTGNPANSPLDIIVTGQALALNSTSIVLNPSANPTSFGQAVTFIAAVSSGIGTPTGTVTFMDGTATLGTGTLDASGTATFATSTLAVGSHPITAQYNGDSQHGASTSNSVSEVIQQATTTALVSSQNPSKVKASVTLTVTVTGKSGGPVPSGDVVFYDGGTAIGNGTLNTGGVAVFADSSLTVGSHSITASYGGDTYNLTSTSTAVAQTVGSQNTSTAVTASANPAIYKNSVTFTATVSVTGTGPATGGVTFYDGATQIGTGTLDSSGTTSISTAALASGAHTITAVYAGDANDSGSTSSALAETIQQATTRTTVSYSPTPAIAGKGTTFTATVDVTAGGGTPTGTVAFTDGSASLGNGTLNASGTVSITVNLGSGPHSIVATYAGDTNDTGSASAPDAFTVQQAMTATALVGTPNPSTLGAAVAFTATVTGNGATPSGSVTLLADGVPVGTQPLNSAGTAAFSVTSLPVGAHAMVAKYAGDSNDAASVSTAYSQTVQKATSTVALNAAPNPAPAGNTVTFAVTVTGTSPAPSGTVVLQDSGSTIGTATLSANGTASFAIKTLSVGPHSITAVYGGDANYTGSSASLTQRIQPNTQAVLTASVNPSIAGAPVVFTATITGTAGSPTGNILFNDGGNTLATVPLDASGRASFQTTSLAIGQHSMTAVYPGDVNNAGTTSTVYTQTVQQATTSTVLTAAGGPLVAGKALAFTATVTGNGGKPGGLVNFYDQGKYLGSGSLNASGQAVFSDTALAAGAHSLTATYVGDTNDGASTSTAISISVLQATTSVQVVSSLNPSVATSPVTFTATVTGNGGMPTGMMIFKDGATVLGSIPLGATGVASYTPSALAVGSHAITANYQGDANDAASSSGLTQIVQQAGATLALTPSPNPGRVGQAVTLTANLAGAVGTPTGSITFKDGGATIATVSVGAAGVTQTTLTLALGQHALSAAYSGDANNAAAQSAAVTETIQQTTSTTIASGSNPSIGGTSVTFTAHVSAANGGAVTGTVAFRDGNNALGTGTLNAAGTAVFSTTALSVGQHSIIAVYGGDTLDLSSTSAGLTQTVSSAGTSVKLTSSNNPSLLGASVTFQVNVTGNGVTPTGTVTFKDGAAALGTATLANGAASLSTSNLAVGVHAITASYNGDTDDQASTSNILTQTVQLSTTLSLSSSANPSLAASQVTFTAQLTTRSGVIPGGTISFKDGTTSLGVATIGANGVAVYTTSSLTVGQHSITAVYGGDTTDTAATSNIVTQMVQAIATHTSLAASGSTLTTDQQLTLISTVSSAGGLPITGTVSFRNGADVIGTATVNGAGTATLTPSLSPGTYTIIAVYSGDALNASSTSAAVSITVTQATDFNLTLNPSSVTMQTKQNSTISLTINSENNFSDQIGLGCASLPASITCTFSKDSVALPKNGSATVQLTIDTTSPLVSGGSAKNAAPTLPGRPASMAAAFLFPGSILFGLLLWRGRKRYAGLLSVLAVVLLAGTTMAISGCSSLNINGASPGTYVIQVVSTGATTHMTHTTNLTITVK